MSDDQTHDTPDVSRLQAQIANLNKALSGLREENSGYKSKLSEIETADEQRRRDEQEAREEYKALYQTASTERDDFKARFEALNAREIARIEAVAASNSARIEKLPEAARSTIPDGLDADAVSKLLTGLEALTATPDTRARGGRGGSGNDTGEEIPAAIAAEVAAEAAKHGHDPKVWYKIHKRRFDRRL